MIPPTAAFISRLADTDRDSAALRSKLAALERKLETLASTGYVDTVLRTMEGEDLELTVTTLEFTNTSKFLLHCECVRFGWTHLSPPVWVRRYCTPEYGPWKVETYYTYTLELTLCLVLASSVFGKLH